jgi:hypothetical protein
MKKLMLVLLMLSFSFAWAEKPISKIFQAAAVAQETAKVLNKGLIEYKSIQDFEKFLTSEEDKKYLKTIVQRPLLPKKYSAMAFLNQVHILNNKKTVAVLTIESLEPLKVRKNKGDVITIDPKNIRSSIRGGNAFYAFFSTPAWADEMDYEAVTQFIIPYVARSHEWYTDKKWSDSEKEAMRLDIRNSLERFKVSPEITCKKINANPVVGMKLTSEDGATQLHIVASYGGLKAVDAFGVVCDPTKAYSCITASQIKANYKAMESDRIFNELNLEIKTKYPEVQQLYIKNNSVEPYFKNPPSKTGKELADLKQRIYGEYKEKMDDIKKLAKEKEDFSMAAVKENDDLVKILKDSQVLSYLSSGLLRCCEDANCMANLAVAGKGGINLTPDKSEGTK